MELPCGTTHPWVTLGGDLVLLCRLTGIPALSSLYLKWLLVHKTTFILMKTLFKEETWPEALSNPSTWSLLDHLYLHACWLSKKPLTTNLSATVSKLCWLFSIILYFSICPLILIFIILLTNPSKMKTKVMCMKLFGFFSRPFQEWASRPTSCDLEANLSKANFSCRLFTTVNSLAISCQSCSEAPARVPSGPVDLLLSVLVVCFKKAFNVTLLWYLSSDLPN